MTYIYPQDFKNMIGNTLLALGVMIPGNLIINKLKYSSSKKGTYGYPPTYDRSPYERLDKNAILSNDFIRYPNDYISFVILGGIIIPYLKYNAKLSDRWVLFIASLGFLIIISPDYVNRLPLKRRYLEDDSADWVDWDEMSEMIQDRRGTMKEELKYFSLEFLNLVKFPLFTVFIIEILMNIKKPNMDSIVSKFFNVKKGAEHDYLVEVI